MGNGLELQVFCFREASQSVCCANNHFLFEYEVETKNCRKIHVNAINRFLTPSPQMQKLNSLTGAIWILPAKYGLFAFLQIYMCRSHCRFVRFGLLPRQEVMVNVHIYIYAFPPQNLQVSFTSSRFPVKLIQGRRICRPWFDGQGLFMHKDTVLIKTKENEQTVLWMNFLHNKRHKWKDSFSPNWNTERYNSVTFFSQQFLFCGGAYNYLRLCFAFIAFTFKYISINQQCTLCIAFAFYVRGTVSMHGVEMYVRGTKYMQGVQKIVVITFYWTHNSTCFQTTFHWQLHSWDHRQEFIGNGL